MQGAVHEITTLSGKAFYGVIVSSDTYTIASARPIFAKIDELPLGTPAPVTIVPLAAEDPVTDGYILCHQQVIPVPDRISDQVGEVGPVTLEKVKQALKVLYGLS